MLGTITKDMENRDPTGNNFLLRMIHAFYEDCDGGVKEKEVSTSNFISDLKLNNGMKESVLMPNRKGIGIKLEDITESLVCCACCVDDEQNLITVVQQEIQQLFEKTSTRSIDDDVENVLEGTKSANVLSLIRHPILQSITNIERISQKEYVAYVLKNPQICSTFSSLLEKYRTRIQPYVVSTK